MLKVSLTSPHGAERIVALLSPDAIVGYLSMIDGMPKSASVTAITDCELRFVSRATFEEATQRHPEIYRFLVKIMAARLRETADSIAAWTFMTMKGRLARALADG